MIWKSLQRVWLHSLEVAVTQDGRREEAKTRTSGLYRMEGLEDPRWLDICWQRQDTEICKWRTFKDLFIIVNNVLTIFVQPTSGKYNLDDHDQDLSEPDHPGRHTTDIYDQYNPGKLTIN